VGALKELDAGHAEIKSMRTARAHLRKGVAAALLAHLIAEAKRRGYQRLSLENRLDGLLRPAHNLYRKFASSRARPCRLRRGPEQPVPDQEVVSGASGAPRLFDVVFAPRRILTV
jgi:GNAT superfamily N-acetyltransferase